MNQNYNDVRSTGLQHNPISNIYYKGVSISTAEKAFTEGIVGEAYQRFRSRAVYVSKSKQVAETYAQQVNGVVIKINADNLNVKPSGHSNQFIIENRIPKENIIDIYRVEKVEDNYQKQRNFSENGIGLYQ